MNKRAGGAESLFGQRQWNGTLEQTECHSSSYNENGEDHLIEIKPPINPTLSFKYFGMYVDMSASLVTHHVNCSEIQQGISTPFCGTLFFYLTAILLPQGVIVYNWFICKLKVVYSVNKYVFLFSYWIECIEVHMALKYLIFDTQDVCL